jgi:cytochrome c
MFRHFDLLNLYLRRAAPVCARGAKSARTLAPITASLLAVTMSFAANADDDAGTVAKGRSLVEANCSRCHAIGKDDTSHHPEAPPFRVVVTRYPPDNIAEALAEGIVSGHPDMPEFVFQPTEIGAIIAYLNTLAPAPAAPASGN